MAKYGYSLDVGEELERELEEVESRITQYGKVKQSEDPLFDEEKEEGKESKSEKKQPKKAPQKEPPTKAKTPKEQPKKIKVERREEKPAPAHKREEKPEKKAKTPEPESKKEEPPNPASPQGDEGTDWVTAFVWIAVVLLAGYFAWSFFQPVNASSDSTQCAINAAGNNIALVLEEEKALTVRSFIREGHATKNLNEARTAYLQAACNGELSLCDNTPFIIITPKNLNILGVGTPATCRTAGSLTACDNNLIMEGDNVTISGKEPYTITTVSAGKGTTRIVSQTGTISATVYEGKEGSQAIIYPRELTGSMIVRLYTRDSITEDTGLSVQYETGNPRIVGYTTE